MESPIFLDHGTTTRPSDFLISQMQPFFKRHWFCPSAPYLKGKEPFAIINQKVRKIVKFLGGDTKDRFVFTSCGGEAISQIYFSVALNESLTRGKNHFITTKNEDAFFLMGMDRFKGIGIEKKWAPLNQEGILTPEMLEQAVSPRTALLSLSWANSLTGVVQPIELLAEVCKEKEILLHVDVSDILGKFYFNFRDLPLNFLTFDGDRFYAPKGTGGLLAKHSTKLEPLIPDGMQQRGDRGGTLNLPALVGLGIAFEELEEHMTLLSMESARLRDQFEESIALLVKEALFLFRGSPRLPNVSVVAFPGIHHELLAFHLAEQNIYPGFGGGRHQKLAQLLINLGIDPKIAKCALSFSLGRETTEEDLKKASGVIVDTVKKCRAFSKELIL